MKLFTFHCAGGSSSIYSGWDFKGIEIIPIDLPGRGSKVNLPLIKNFDDAIESILPEIEEVVERSFTWGVLGHSMGSMFAYEITRRLNKYNPSLRILTGINPLKNYSGLVKEIEYQDFELIKKMEGLGGIPPHLVQNPIFLKWFAPIIRADLSLVDSYTFENDNSSVPTYVVNGDKDHVVKKENTELWNEIINNLVSKKMIKGGHFSLFEQPKIVQDIIWETAPLRVGEG